jgi:hypothetical protein
MKTTSLELSKQLKEAGFPQESTFQYSTWTNKRGDQVRLAIVGVQTDVFATYAAPTAEEILERLPEFIEGETYFVRLKTYPYTWKGVKGWHVVYADLAHQSMFVEESNDSLAEAAGKMWLYLKENNLLTHSGISI